MSRPEKITYAIQAVAVWLYVLLRSIYVPITFDEAANFFHYIQTGNIWPGDPLTHWDANNHLLNSFLTHYSYLIFGSEEWALRLPTVLISIFFFLYVFLFAKEVKSGVLRWAFILSLLFAHYFIEFFAYTRGYGISMALLLPALFHSLQFFKSGKLGHISAGLIFLGLAVFANLTLVNTYLLIIGLMAVFILWKALMQKSMLWKFLPLFILGVVPLVLFAGYGFQLKEGGHLYYGSKEGFWDVTVVSLMEHFSWEGNTIGLLLVAFLFITVIVVQSYKLNHFKFPHFFRNDWFFTLLLVLNVLGNIMMNLLFDANFPEDRIGVFYFPLFIGALCFSLDFLEVRYKFSFSIAALVILLFFPVYFLLKLNLSHSTSWPFDAPLKRYHDTILEDHGTEGVPPVVSGYHLRILSFAYHNYQSGGYLNQIEHHNTLNDEADYQIVTDDQCQNCEAYEQLAEDNSISGIYLMKRKTPLQRKILTSKTGIETPPAFAGEFSDIGVFEADTLQGKSLEVEFQFTFESDEKPLKVWIVGELKDEQGQLLVYKFNALNFFRGEWNGRKNNFNHAMVFSEIPADGKQLKFYLWNIHQRPYQLKNGSVKVKQMVYP